MKTANRLVVLMFLPVLFVFCTNRDNTSTEIIRKVKVINVQKADSLIRRDFSGVIREAGEANLAFRVAGPIQEIFVEEGDFVQKGQPVAQIDPRDYEVQLAAAKAQYEQVQSESERIVELHTRNSVTANDFEKAIAGKRMAQAKLKNAEDQLTDTQLIAPFTGYIQEVNYEPGEIVNAGMPVVSLIDVSYFVVEVDIPVFLYLYRDRFASFACSQKLIPGIEFPLELSGYAKKANSNQLYTLYLRMNPELSKELAPGMDVRVSVILPCETENPLYIPLKALYRKDNKTYVWVYDPDSGRVHSREVRTGRLEGEDGIRIAEGLDGSEMVVTAGIHTLSENLEVERIRPDSETNIGGLL
jgi:RND family efflux transporter MFP subunit